MSLNAAIIIFVRNPELGKVKTRLAATIGEENALKVYQLLLEHTRSLVMPVSCHKYIFYADLINPGDQWNGADVFKKQQHGQDLGMRMKNAFAEILHIGYEKVIIIGSDCYELTLEIITEALAILAEKDVVIGPALDGGYYLLGMKRLHPYLFDNKTWSSSTVFENTIQDINRQGVSYALLPVLNDVDKEKDITFSY